MSFPSVQSLFDFCNQLKLYYVKQGQQLSYQLLLHTKPFKLKKSPNAENQDIDKTINEVKIIKNVPDLSS